LPWHFDVQRVLVEKLKGVGKGSRIQEWITIFRGSIGDHPPVFAISTRKEAAHGKGGTLRAEQPVED